MLRLGHSVTTANIETSQKSKSTKKQRLLSNPEVKRWYDNLARGSPLTAMGRLSKLSRFCEQHQITPMELVELGHKDAKTLTDIIQDHIATMEEEGKAPQYIASTLVAVRSWLRHFDIQLTRKLKVRDIESTPTLKDERTPNGEELTEIMNRVPLRTAVAISLIAKSGLRPQVLGNHDGTDGLTIGDVPDIVIQQGVARCLRSPIRILVRKNLSKNRNAYFTFLSSEGTKKLLAYLNDRLVKGESLNAESPIIGIDHTHPHGRGNNKGKRFLETYRISYMIRKAIRPRFKFRPYVFRSFFDTQLLIAENRGRIAHDFRIFFMGHRGGIEGKYTTNKGILPQELIEEMREAYKRSEEFLDLEVTQQDPLLKQKEKLYEEIAKATPEQVQKILAMLSIGKT